MSSNTVIRRLFVMRSPESSGGVLTEQGLAQVRLAATGIRENLVGVRDGMADFVVICSNQSQTVQAAIHILLTLNVPQNKILQLASWPREESSRGSTDELDIVHNSVMGNQHAAVIVILPPKLAAQYPLHFMLKERVGRPNPRLLNALDPGETVIVNCVNGLRDTITMPGNSFEEQLASRLASR